MQWQDSGVIIGHKPFGESSCIQTIFTKENGIYKGMYSSKKQISYGSIVSVNWKARTDDHLGRWTITGVYNPHIASVLESRSSIFALASVCNALLHLCPERMQMPMTYKCTTEFLRFIGTKDIIAKYMLFESIMLSEIGYARSNFSNDILSENGRIFLRRWPEAKAFHTARRNFLT